MYSLAGTGIGLAYVPCISVVGMYFDKKRTVAIGIVVSGLGVGTCIAPPTINGLVNHYGWRGCLLLLGGLCSHLVVCGALFRPLTKRKHKQIETSHNKAKYTDIDSHYQKEWKTLTKLIFSNTSYLLLCLNNVLFTFGLAVVYVHLAAYAMTTGISVTQGAMLFSTVGITNTIGRVMYGVIAYTTSVDHVLLYGIAMVTTGITTMICPIMYSYVGLLCSSGVFGLLSAGFGTLLPQNIILFLSPDLLSIAYGYILVAEAMGTLLGGPVAG